MHKLVTTIIILFSINLTFGCSCVGSKYFELSHFDMNKYVFAVSIDSVYIPENDTTQNSSEIPPPPSLYQYNLAKGYHIRIKEVFKGEIDLNLKIIDFPLGSSCSWTPEIGNTYIFYTNSINNIEMCERKVVLEYDSTQYLKEQEILRILQDQPRIVKIKLNNRLFIEGQNIDGKREGKWKIYSPESDDQIVYELTFVKGLPTKITKGEGYDNSCEWDKIAFSYYSKSIAKRE